jgi:phosphoglycolate phosphatase
LFEGAAFTLQKLHDRGVRCAIVSNKGSEAVQRSLKASGIDAYVAIFVGEQPGVLAKPHPAILLEHVIPRFPEIDRERMLMIGDTEADIQFARNAGIKAGWAAYGYGRRESCEALGPDFQINRITEVLLLNHIPDENNDKKNGDRSYPQRKLG